MLNVWPGSPLFCAADNAIFGRDRKTFVPYENDIILKTRLLKSRAKQALMGCPGNFIYQRGYLELIQHCGVLICQHRMCQKSAIQTVQLDAQMAIVNNRPYDREVATLSKILESGSFGPVESQVRSKTRLVVLNRAFSKYYK